MAPEQVLGKETDHRADIFSMGTLLYEMLSGNRPFIGDTIVSVMNAIVSREPKDLPEQLPQAITGIVQRCLAKQPECRFQSAADLGFALSIADRAQPSVLPSEPGKKSRKTAAATAALLILGGSGLYWLGLQSSLSDRWFWGLARNSGRAIVAEIQPPEDNTFSFIGSTGGAPALFS